MKKELQRWASLTSFDFLFNIDKLLLGTIHINVSQTMKKSCEKATGYLVNQL
jgi:hypothetical protein